MRILHLIYDDLDNPWVGGGGAVRTYEVNRRLASRHEITVLTGNFPGAKRTQIREGVHYRRVGLSHSYLLSRFSYCLRAAWYIHRAHFDLLVDDFSAHSPVLAPLHTCKPVVLMAQNLFGAHSIHKHLLLGSASYLTEKLGLRCYYHGIAVSSALGTQLLPRLACRAVVEVINNAPEEAFFSLELTESKFSTEEPYILFLGRLEVYQKGLDRLIPTLATLARKHPGVRLKIAGRGREEEERKLQNLIHQSGMGDRVERVGFVQGAEKRKLLSACLFLCIPSRFEGWPITAIEAAACQKPVVGTDIAGLSDAVKHGQTGLLVPPEEPDLLAEAMVHLVADEQTRNQMGQAAGEWARQFSWDAVAQQQEQFYCQVASLR